MTTLPNASTIAFVCTPVLDLRVHVDPALFLNQKKTDSQISTCLGGGGPNAARAAKASGVNVVPILLTGDDAGSLMLATLSRNEFPEAIILPTLEESRMSILCGESCVTVRPGLRSQTLSTAAAEALRDADWTVMAPMSAADSCFVYAVLERSRHSLLQLSTGQLQNPEESLRMGRKATWIVLNRSELSIWTGSQETLAGLKWLRSQGIVNALVTDSQQIDLLVNAREFHSFKFSPLKVSGSTIGAGDHFTGTFVSNLAQNGHWRFSLANAHAATVQFLKSRPAPPATTRPLLASQSTHKAQQWPMWRRLTSSVALVGSFLAGTQF